MRKNISYLSNIKKEKGITLVALIITVIVMLILAGVSISVLTSDGGLFDKTKNAAQAYEDAAQKEANDMQSWLNKIDEIINYNTIYIYTKEELEQFRDDVNNGNTFKGKTVMLMNDIDLGGNENDKSTWWEPIGYSTSDEIDFKKTFSGIFEGNNYVIEGIYNKVEEGKQAVGLFSLIDDAIINNLTISGDIILGENIGTDTNLAGAGLVGNVWGNSVISNCINKVNVTKNSTGRDVAGLVGAVNNGEDVLTIKNCINYGNITGGNNCGGIIGNVNDGNVIIEDSCNKGGITNYVGNNTGGLIGRDGEVTENNNSIIINNSYNESVIKGKGDIGGLCGRVNGSIVIKNSYNNAEIYNSQRTAYVCIGGLIGRVWQTSSNCIITNAYNSNNIIVEEGNYGTNVGGLIGEARAITTNILNSYNLGDISNGNYVSGICGVVYAPANTSPTININNCYNVGSVSGLNTRGIMLIYNSPITVNANNIYLLNTVSDVGISNLDTENPIEISVNMLSEDQMKRKEFVNELNANLSSINTENNLKKWKYVNNNYPVFE